MHLRVERALNFTITAVVHEHHVEFNGYEIKNIDEPPAYEGPSGELVSDPSQAVKFFHGFVKWDGCSNWMFDENAREVYLHACDRDILRNVVEAMSVCWDWTADLLPTWNA
jgi:hypothetical protein